MGSNIQQNKKKNTTTLRNKADRPIDLPTMLGQINPLQAQSHRHKHTHAHPPYTLLNERTTQKGMCKQRHAEAAALLRYVNTPSSLHTKIASSSFEAHQKQNKKVTKNNNVSNRKRGINQAQQLVTATSIPLALCAYVIEMCVRNVCLDEIV